MANFGLDAEIESDDEPILTAAQLKARSAAGGSGLTAPSTSTLTASRFGSSATTAGRTAAAPRPSLIVSSGAGAKQPSYGMDAEIDGLDDDATLLARLGGGGGSSATPYRDALQATSNAGAGGRVLSRNAPPSTATADLLSRSPVLGRAAATAAPRPPPLSTTTPRPDQLLGLDAELEAADRAAAAGTFGGGGRQPLQRPAALSVTAPPRDSYGLDEEIDYADSLRDAPPLQQPLRAPLTQTQQQQQQQQQPFSFPAPGGAGRGQTRTQTRDSYGLGAEMDEAGTPQAGPGFGFEAELGPAPTQQLRRATGQQQQYGLDSEVGQAAAAATQPPPLPPLQQQQQQQEQGVAMRQVYGTRQQQFGLDAEVVDTRAHEGYGLAEELQPLQQQQQAAEATTMMLQPLKLTAGPMTTAFMQPGAQQQALVMMQSQMLPPPPPAELMQAVQSIAATTGHPPLVVDTKAAQRKFADNLRPDELLYIQGLETQVPGKRFPPNVKPSVLQHKFKHQEATWTSVALPKVDSDGQTFVDFDYSRDGALNPNFTGVWQFGMTPLKASAVGPSGVGATRPLFMHSVRMCLLDTSTNRFLGNVYPLPVSATNKEATVWSFDAEPLLVRCSCIQVDYKRGTHMISADKLALYVELNTSYRLLPEDARLLPNNEAKANKVLNELCVAWALVPVPACLNLAAPRELSVPLLAGPINKPVPLDALYASGQLPKPPGVGGRGLFGGGKQQTQAVLALRVGPLPAMPLPVIPYSFMPPNLVSDVPLSYAFAAFRMALGAELVYQPTAFTPIADAVVASFPRILNDHHMFSAFMTKWTAVLQPFLKLAKQAAAYKDRERMPTLAAVVEAFRQCVIEAAPVLHCQAVLPKHINNFVQHNQARANVVQAYFSNVDPKRGGMPVAPRDPVEPLSHAASQFLHKPFDVSELRVCLADALPQTTWLHA